MFASGSDGKEPLGFAAVADVRPFNALHYDLDVVGSLGDVTSPPYDVIDAAQRAALLERSPTTWSRSICRRPRTGQDPDAALYAHAAETIDAWRAEGVLLEDSEPVLWALTQDYTAPDGSSNTRHGILARVGSRTTGPARSARTSARCRARRRTGST